MMDMSVVDPEISQFLASMARAWSDYPPFMSMPLADARLAAEAVRAPWTHGGPEMEKTFDKFVMVDGSALRVRVFDPGLAPDAPLLIYLHGGGFTLFSLDTHARLMREYAAAAGVIVVGVDYPLSPEVRYPVALDQIVGLLDWMSNDGARALGGDPGRLAIGGDSAGANLSLAAALRLRDRGTPEMLRAMLLNYGAFTGRCSDEAEALFGGVGSVLDRAEVEYYFRNYLGDHRFESDDPYACQAHADLSGLPPAFLVIPECDVLSEQSYAMVERMRAAGVEVSSETYAGATHSFLEAMSIAPIARRAIADAGTWLKQRLAEPSNQCLAVTPER